MYAANIPLTQPDYVGYNAQSIDVSGTVWSQYYTEDGHAYFVNNATGASQVRLYSNTVAEYITACISGRIRDGQALLATPSTLISSQVMTVSVRMKSCWTTQIL
jgi:hypothetical protein